MSRRKKLTLPGKEDDYKSTFTDAVDGASVVPSEYSGETDYKSMYTDENASVFSGLTGAETAETATVRSETSRVSKKKKKMKPKTVQKDGISDFQTTYSDGRDGAETVSHSEYFNEDNRAADYQSMYTDDKATVFSGLTGMDGAETVYTGMDGAETATVYTAQDGDDTASEATKTTRKRKRKRRRSKADDRDGKDGARTDEAKADSNAAPLNIPIICKTDVDALYNNTVYVEGQTEFQTVDEGGAESVYSSIYMDGKDEGETLFNSIYGGETQNIPINDGSGDGAYDALYTGLIGEDGLDYGSAYDGGFSQQQGGFSPNYAIAFLESDSWITYIFVFLTILLIACVGSVIYLMVETPIGDSESFRQVVENLTLRFEELEQTFMLTMEETNELNNKTNSTLHSINATQQELIMNMLEPQIQESNELASRINAVGLTPSTAVRSCASLPQYYEPDFYYISSTTGSPVRVFCNNTFECNGLTGGWTRVAKLNATANLSLECPPGSMSQVAKSNRWCVSQLPREGCSTLMFGRIGIPYSHVCGRILGHQLGLPSAFFGQHNGIDGPYVDGISITHGSPRQHIWTFAAARDETSGNNGYVCPCTLGGLGLPPPPTYVGNNYFCDSGVSDGVSTGALYLDNPLWDGAGCSRSSTCCEFNRPPWFYRHLPEPTVDDVEVRVCRDTFRITFDVLIEEVEIYIRQ